MCWAASGLGDCSTSRGDVIANGEECALGERSRSGTPSARAALAMSVRVMAAVDWGSRPRRRVAGRRSVRGIAVVVALAGIAKIAEAVTAKTTTRHYDPSLLVGIGAHHGGTLHDLIPGEVDAPPTTAFLRVGFRTVSNSELQHSVLNSAGYPGDLHSGQYLYGVNARAKSWTDNVIKYDEQFDSFGGQSMGIGLTQPGLPARSHVLRSRFQMTHGGAASRSAGRRRRR